MGKAMNSLREKLMHYNENDLSGEKLKQDAIMSIEDILRYRSEDELLHHSRTLAIAYLALTEEGES